MDKTHGNTGNKNAMKNPGEYKPRKKYRNVSLDRESAERWEQCGKSLGMSLPEFIAYKCDQ